MKTFGKNEALARWAVGKLTQLGHKCHMDDIAANCVPENPSWKQMGVRTDDDPWPHRFVAVWLNGVVAIFDNNEFREWAKANTPNRKVHGANSHLRHQEIAATHTFSYYNLSRLESAGESCGLLLIGSVTMDEIMATLKETEHDRQVN